MREREILWLLNLPCLFWTGSGFPPELGETILFQVSSSPLCSPQTRWMLLKVRETMADDDVQPSTPRKCGPYISSVTSHSLNLAIRGIVLFLIGVFLALVLNLLQIQRNVTLFPPDEITRVFSSVWWVPLCCGTASGMSKQMHSVMWWFLRGVSFALFYCIV